MISYSDLLKINSPQREFAWNDKDAMLYALAVGLGEDPLNLDELSFVYEKNLKLVPSFMTVAAWGSNPSLSEAKVDYSRVVQAGQGITLHRRLPPSARIKVSGAITHAVDKGDKGAIIYAETVFKDVDSGEKYATLNVSWFARNDGNFNGPTTDGEQPHHTPDRTPDRSVDYPTRANQALLYRLLGDRNPLHSDPEVALKAGFNRPILHGLCTYGITCRAVLENYAHFNPDLITSHNLRFSAPVFPGEIITVDMWKDKNVISFEARIKSRDALVIRNGCCILRTTD